MTYLLISHRESLFRLYAAIAIVLLGSSIYFSQAGVYYRVSARGWQIKILEEEKLIASEEAMYFKSIQSLYARAETDWEVLPSNKIDFVKTSSMPGSLSYVSNPGTHDQNTQ